jgi:glycosyltransferase involved in cell wall biosynthesis
MGVDEASLADATPLPQEYIENYLPEDKFIVAYAGTIGITNALDAFMECAQSMQDYRNICFVVVGDGDLRIYYQKKYAHVHNLIFAPRVPKPQVQSVLFRCSLLYFSVHSSKVWCYGQSLNKVIDYMLSGKPIVASYTGFPSMIDEAGCGCYVPAGDVEALRREILHYAAMPADQRLVVGQRGRDWILQHRRYPVLAAQYLGILFPDAPLVEGTDKTNGGARS